MTLKNMTALAADTIAATADARCTHDRKFLDPHLQVRGAPRRARRASAAHRGHTIPEKEAVTDDTQGVQLATIQKLARYWASEHDWRKVEAKLNAYPHFITEIDGLDIHFMHIRSKHENALPLIVTHGWPGSVIEQLKIIEPLTNPTAHGGSAADAFHLVIPSMPGYGFSGKPTTTGWGPERIARAWAR
jgi:pimeloyl-ACP methyl ester carboxylesterase